MLFFPREYPRLDALLAEPFTPEPSEAGDSSSASGEESDDASSGGKGKSNVDEQAEPKSDADGQAEPKSDVDEQASSVNPPLSELLQNMDHTTFETITGPEHYKQLVSEYYRLGNDRARDFEKEEVRLTEHEWQFYKEELCRAMVNTTEIVEDPNNMHVRKVLGAKNLEIELLACKMLVSKPCI